MNGNDAAYPSSPDQYSPEFGLTKRELIAAMAMQGLARDGSEDVTSWRIQKMTEYAVECADALLAALERKPE